MVDNSKVGTEIDGVMYTKTGHNLQNKQHVFRLGRLEVDFRSVISIVYNDIMAALTTTTVQDHLATSHLYLPSRPKSSR